MRSFATKPFARFARKAGISEAALIDAARNVARGRFDADLGGHVYKQRISRQGGGKSGGYRTIVLFRRGRHCFFAFGFAKSSKSSLTTDELDALRKLAAALLAYSTAELEAAVRNGDLSEVADGD